MTDAERLREELARLRQRVRDLEGALDRSGPVQGADPARLDLVDVPGPFIGPFLTAQDYVREYFADWKQDPASATLEFSGERYILIRAASMSAEFFDLVTSLYRDRGPREARSVAHGFLFDVAHALGKADAASFHDRMMVTDPVEKLSAGPVHFAFSGWARVSIHPDSKPSPDEEYFLTYDHPNSFEADSWLKRGPKTDFPVCMMNAGYSSGWCEESFQVPLVAAEITCRAMGDPHCRFVMAHPSRIQDHLKRLQARQETRDWRRAAATEVPEFFQRKRLEDELRRARDQLEERVRKRTVELERRITELRLANDRLEEMERVRADFVATISHELRTPLVTGLGYVELLLEGKLGTISEETRGGMQVGLRNLERLAGLVDNILTYHRLTGREESVSPRPAPFDLGSLCRECHAEFLVRAGRDPATVFLDLPGGETTVEADQEMIRRVIANLLDNAGRHAGEAATIRLALERMPAGVRFTLSDDGRGMSKDLLAAAANPLSVTKPRGEGLGLGLSIVASLLEAHGEDLSLTSEEGRGTTAAFTLPATVASAGPGDSSHPADAVPAGSEGDRSPGNLILLIEDDEDSAGFIELALTGEGYRVKHVFTAEDALVFLEQECPDLMLVDLTLPGMSGTEFCRRVKGDPETSRTPLHMFTARAEQEPRRQATEAGCDGYLVKPVLLADLLEHVGKALETPPGRASS